MSHFEKILIPFLDKNMYKIDFTSSAGFVDAYEDDEDSPNDNRNIYLMYDMKKHNLYTQSRATRFELSSNLLKSYTKIIDNKPYLIYCFHVKQKYKKFFDGIINLTHDEKISILQFWGSYDDSVKFALANPAIQFTGGKSIPAEDYIEQTKGITIQKAVQQSPFIFLLLYLLSCLLQHYKPPKSSNLPMQSRFPRLLKSSRS